MQDTAPIRALEVDPGSSRARTAGGFALLNCCTAASTSFPTGSPTPRGRSRCGGAGVWQRAVDGFRHIAGYRCRSCEQWLGVEKLGRGLVRRACVALHIGLERKAAAACRGAGGGSCFCSARSANWFPRPRPRVSREVIRPPAQREASTLLVGEGGARRRCSVGTQYTACIPRLRGAQRQAARRVVKTTAPSSGLGFRVLQSVGLHADQADRPGLQLLDSRTQRCGARQRVWAVGEGRPICQGAVPGLRGCG